MPYFCFLIVLFFPFCLNAQSVSIPANFEFYAHRGGRGIMPENTIPAFLKSVDLGVLTLEMDVVMSQDKEVVVSHDAFFSKEICVTPEGEKIGKEKEHFLYKMPYATIKKYDCGCNGNGSYPQQEKISAYRPLFRDVVEAVTTHLGVEKSKELIFNVEIKFRKKKQGELYPFPTEYVKLVLAVIKEMGIEERVILQSFDVDILRAVKQQAPDIATLLLFYNLKSVDKNIRRLGFLPTYYSIFYKLLSLKKKAIKKAQAKGMKVVTWTVNDVKKMKKLVAKGVDGIMTDYPNLKQELFNDAN